MADQSSSLLNFLAWFTGVIVSLVVAFGMVEGVLRLPTWLGGTSTVGIWIVWVVGWIVMVTTLVGVIMAVLKR